jgi:integrase
MNKIRESTGGGYTRRGKHYIRVTDRTGHRTGERAPWASSRQEAIERGKLVQTWVNALRAAGQDDFVGKVIEQGALASTPERLAAVAHNVEVLTAGRFDRIEPAKKKGGPVTFRTFAERWTSGELARLYPDNVKEKSSAEDDVERLEKHVYPHVQDVPMASFTRAHADGVMAKVPRTLKRGTRRHVAQLINRVLHLAVFTDEIKSHPLPRGWLPRASPSDETAKEALLPSEEAKLLGGRSKDGKTVVPLEYRVLYAFFDREGMRKGEAERLTWGDVDIERGIMSLDENKTNRPRSWVLCPDVVKMLAAWKEISGGKLGRVFPGITDWGPLAETYRGHCAAVGIDRARLFQKKHNKLRLRAHDMRAFFTTAAMFADRDMLWITDRTGHTSITMLRRYQRDMRSWRELGEAPADASVAIPEIAAAFAAAESGGNAVSSDRPGSATRRNHSGSGVGIRTPINGSKVRCPAIGRRRKRPERAEIGP